MLVCKRKKTSAWVVMLSVRRVLVSQNTQAVTPAVPGVVELFVEARRRGLMPSTAAVNRLLSAVEAEFLTRKIETHRCNVSHSLAHACTHDIHSCTLPHMSTRPLTYAHELMYAHKYAFCPIRSAYSLGSEPASRLCCLMVPTLHFLQSIASRILVLSRVSFTCDCVCR